MIKTIYRRYKIKKLVVYSIDFASFFGVNWPSYHKCSSRLCEGIKWAILKINEYPGQVVNTSNSFRKRDICWSHILYHKKQGNFDRIFPFPLKNHYRIRSKEKRSDTWKFLCTHVTRGSFLTPLAWSVAGPFAELSKGDEVSWMSFEAWASFTRMSTSSLSK